MCNLSCTYSELGRYRDALELQEKTLEFRRRVLPENHPDIGIYGGWFVWCKVMLVDAGNDMNNLAKTYHSLGRFQDSLALQEKTLAFFRRVLPENHPTIGVK